MLKFIKKLLAVASAAVILSAFLAVYAPSEPGIGFGTVNVYAASEKSKNDYKSNAQISKASDQLYSAYIKKIGSRKNELSSGKLTINGQTMKVYMKKIGKPDKNGYPLYIALRGGGVEDASVAEEQFEAMKSYYSSAVKSGIYVVPQPITPSWDEHYRPESFLFYDRIIEDAAAFYNADPNRVYIMGFSSGGDGVYAISPRYADRLAAVNMSAGYPHVLRIGNMYNLPMCIQAGEYDTAFDRHIKAAEFDALLSSYAKKYGGGYVHETFIHVNGDHNSWDDVYNTNQNVFTGTQVAAWLKSRSSAKQSLKKTGAVNWVNNYTRDPLPTKVVWEPYINAGLRTSQAFYWLDHDGALSDTTIVASYNRSKNLVNIEQCDAEKGTLKIYLNPKMVDVFKDVTVKCGGRTVKVRPIVSKQIMQSTLEARGDKNYIFTSEIDIKFSSGKKPQIKAVSKASASYNASGSELVSWDSNGLFSVDSSLFGLTLAQLKVKLGYEFTKPVKWEYWGNGLTWTHGDFNGRSVIFMFQNNKTAIIYSETEGSVTSKLKNSAVKRFGESTGVFTNGGLCRFYLESNYYDNTDHVQQRYVYYKYKD